MAREYLSKIDTTLLNLEDPTNPMMVTCIMITGAPIDFERLKAVVEVRLLGMDRFQQRVVRSRLGLGAPYWQDDPDFDLGYHLRRATLPPPCDQAALQEIVGLLASTPLDLSRPLWQIHLVESCDQGSALVFRFHHCIADGMALIHILLSMTDGAPDAPWPASAPEDAWRDEGGPFAEALQAARSRLKSRRRTAGKVMQEGLDVLSNPSRVLDASRSGRDALAQLGRFVLFESDPDTVLKGKLGESKRAAWSTAISLQDVSTIQNSLGGTVNDVLLAAMTGALRRYMQERGELVDHIGLRAAVPINLRSAGHEKDLGNRMGAVFLELPVNIADPVERLNELEHRMNGRKESMEPALFYFLLNALGVIPAQVVGSLVNTFGNRATAVMTNVRGPRQRLYLTGVPLDTFMGWVPQTGPLGVGVSILSYVDKVGLGVLTDEGLVPDPERIIAAFHDEFEMLLARALDADRTASGEMAADLDDALATLDTMLEDQDGGQEG